MSARGGARVVALALATAAIAFVAAPTAAADDPGVQFVPSVEGAFGQLSQRPDYLAIAPTMGRDGTLCKHYQGMARVNGPDGTPYLIVTKSGNHSICVLEDDEPGWLYVFKLGSRNTVGERLGSNFLPYGSTHHSIYPAPLPNFADDHTVGAWKLDGTDIAASFHHPGGMQVVGNVLAVGAENGFNGEPSGATVLFFDVSNPEEPQLTSKFHVPGSGDDLGADPVGLTPVKASDGKCCRYLLIVSGGDGNDRVAFYLSNPDEGKTTTTLSSAGLTWTLDNQVFTADGLSDCIGQDWPTAGIIPGGQHQMLNFVREGGLDGPLYLLAGRRDGTIATPGVSEYLDLYRMNVSSDGAVGDCPFTHVATKEVDTDAWANEGTSSSFAAAAGVYVSPTGELIVYDGRHDIVDSFDLSDPQNPIWLSHHMAIGEYRSGSLVRPGSPTLRPTATVDGPVTVDEGSSVTLSGHGRQAFTKAFVQLFEDDGVGSSLPGFLNSDEWLTVEYGSRNADRFDNLDELGGDASDISENAGSLRWFAPPGCTITASDYPRRSGDWPGPDTVFLRGTGQFEQVSDLDHLHVYTPPGSLFPQTPVPAGETGSERSYDDDIGGVTFYHPVTFGDGVANDQDCQSYYNQTIGLGWDLDGNGSYETSGTTATFSAATLDGPSTVTVAARAQHPTDHSSTGTGDRVPVPIEVRNVPPQVASATVVDSLGQRLDDGSHVALIGLPVTLSVDFTDPGVADTQTAGVDWGDGMTTSSGFATFTDAHGGATGHLVHAHAFTTPGSVTISVTVTDDDGGATTVQRTITVLSLEGAVTAAADRLTQLIAGATNADVASALRAARDDLIGNHGGKPPTNGALDKLEAGDPVGAITKLEAVMGDLATAEAAGAGDLTSLKDLVGLVAEGIATREYQRARDRFPSPSPGQVSTLATIADLIATGHGQLVAHRYTDACESFRQAASKAINMKR